jgi:hypothetical protein
LCARRLTLLYRYRAEGETQQPRQGVVEAMLELHHQRAVGLMDWLGLAMEQWGKLETEDDLPNKGHNSHYRMRANAP